MISALLAIVPLLLIDRLCTRHRISSTPYQFAALGLAIVGELTAVGVLNVLVREPFANPGGSNSEFESVLGMSIAACCGLSGAFGVYFLVRTRVGKDYDYDDTIDK